MKLHALWLFCREWLGNNERSHLEILIATVLYESVCKETFLWSQTGWIPAYGENKGIFGKNIGFVAEF